MKNFPKSDKDIERILAKVKGYAVFYTFLDKFDEHAVTDLQKDFVNKIAHEVLKDFEK